MHVITQSVFPYKHLLIILCVCACSPIQTIKILDVIQQSVTILLANEGVWYLQWVVYQGWLLSSLLEDSGSQVVQNVGYGTHHASPSQAAVWGCHHQMGVLPPAKHTEWHHTTIHQLYGHHTSHPKMQKSYLLHHYCWKFQYGISNTLYLQKEFLYSVWALTHSISTAHIAFHLLCIHGWKICLVMDPTSVLILHITMIALIASWL